MKAKIILVAVGAALVLTAVWFFALWSPQGKNLETAQAEQAAAEQQASELQARLVRLQRLEANKEALEAARSLLATAIPSEDQLDTFIVSVNAMAAEAGVDFVSVAPTQPAAASSAATTAGVTAGGALPISLQMSVSGDYFAILRFMEQLRDGDRLVTMDSLSLAQGGEGGKMTAAIGARMFLNPTAPAATTPAADAAAETASA